MNWPFIKFYPRDWQADPELRMCSLESRGFWMECLCIMHSAKRRGYLETPQGQPLTDDHTARLMATFKGDLYRCKEELLLHGVPSVDEETGIWYCRRMVKETQKAEKCSESGRRGGGNPNINKENINKEYIPEARSHISLKVPFEETFKGQDEDAFRVCMDVLKLDQSFENAKKAVYASNESFRTVGRMHIENSLKTQPDRNLWHPAIEGMAAKYAGVKMQFPNKTLQNWLAGKIEKPKAGERKCQIKD